MNLKISKSDNSISISDENIAISVIMNVKKELEFHQVSLRNEAASFKSAMNVQVKLKKIFNQVDASRNRDRFRALTALVSAIKAPSFRVLGKRLEREVGVE